MPKIKEKALNNFLDDLEKDVEVTNGEYLFLPEEVLIAFKFYEMSPIKYFIKQSLWFAKNDQYEMALKKIKYFKRFDSEDFQILATAAELVVMCVRDCE